MLKNINDYLQRKGLTKIDEREYEELVRHVRHNNKVDAIKALRVFSKCVDERCLKCPIPHDEYENDFYEFLLNHGKTVQSCLQRKERMMEDLPLYEVIECEVIEVNYGS